MTPQARTRAERIHAEAFVVNLHDHMGRPQDFEDMLRGGVAAKVYKPMNDGKYYDEQNRRVFPGDGFDWTGHFQQLLGRIEQLERAPGSRVAIARRFSDLAKARQENKAAVIFGNEGSLPLGPNLENFESLYRRGLREIALHWPAGRQTRHIVHDDGTLTPHAYKIIERANELGVALDTCHLSGRPALLQVVEASKTPVIHSHGAGRRPRTPRLPEGDLADEEIRAIAGKGGIIGIHFCTYIPNINGWNWQPTMEDLMPSVEYLVKVGGIESVGIGADYFPYNKEPFDKAFQQVGEVSIEDRDWSRTFVKGLENISQMPSFTAGLVGRGLSDPDIRKILGENALRVFEAVWKN